MKTIGKMVLPSVGIQLSSSFPIHKTLRTPIHLKPPLSNSITNMSSSFPQNTTNRKLPILLFDIMDTIVRDPFYKDIPAFFQMAFNELIECKHPTAWIEFEKGLIDEVELARIFFKDGRDFDLEGLKTCMRNGYQLIEDKLKLSKYLSWTFCSCTLGKRKPDTEFYTEVVRHLEVDPSYCIFIDDRLNNVEAAIEVGIKGVHFKNVDLLREELSLMGIDISTDEDQ
ncbi:unnamed protein product [Trifolium pratense]|uniref:Uncharacterized protein n=1 Tax=Trifolium pratense TaxID=57577 RepID=A0ACB0JLE9_TRIPR|nr:unnamed protein product [Trifolium pratense]